MQITYVITYAIGYLIAFVSSIALTKKLEGEVLVSDIMMLALLSLTSWLFALVILVELIGTTGFFNKKIF